PGACQLCKRAIVWTFVWGRSCARGDSHGNASRAHCSFSSLREARSRRGGNRSGNREGFQSPGIWKNSEILSPEQSGWCPPAAEGGGGDSVHGCALRSSGKG